MIPFIVASGLIVLGLALDEVLKENAIRPAINSRSCGAYSRRF